jgi:RNA polymerase sigma-70 factor (ECF subfamily)
VLVLNDPKYPDVGHYRQLPSVLAAFDGENAERYTGHLDRDVSFLIDGVRNGDRAALDDLVPIVYGELHKIASGYLRRERPEHTLQPTALINEVYLRFLGTKNPDYASRTHFLGVAAYLMRQILTEHARRRHAAKRSLGVTLTLNEALDFSPERASSVIAIDDALTAFAAVDKEEARFVELRYYGGMTAEEIAELTGISVHKVRHGLRHALAWLHREVNGPGAQA